jgi:hypothetical protein
MADNIIGYNSRTFSEIREELVTYIRQYYPEVLADFTDSSVGSMLLDLNAGVANNLGVNTDRAFQETQLEYAQQTANILQIAKNLGFNVGGRTPSVTVVDFTVTVPVKGDQPDENYYPQLLVGSQVVGGGQIFETQEVIDWNSPISNQGEPNRAIVPNLDSNGIIQSYLVTKREVVRNGSTNVFRRIIRDTESIPFYEITLPDPDVLEIQDVILLEGSNFSGNPTEAEWQNSDNKWYEVDWLAQQRVFVDDPNSGSNSATMGATGIKAGRWIETTKKFIKEYTPNGFCFLTFGAGDSSLADAQKCFLKIPVNNQEFLQNILGNRALGDILTKNNTLFIRYRTGGGTQSNVGSNVLTSLGDFQLRVQGPRQDFNVQVQRSLSVNNPIPAIGGNEALNVEEIRNLIKYNFSSQKRDVTINDYLFSVFTIPGKYGSPFRANAFREDNKVVIPILSLNSNGKLSNTSNTVLKDNITEYLTEFRMVNDYVEVRNGRIFNLAFDIDVFVEERTDSEAANSIITTVRDYFDVRSTQMNTDIFLTPLIEQINNVTGVVNVLDITIYNKVGGNYSVNPIPQEIVDDETGEIRVQNQTIYCGIGFTE